MSCNNKINENTWNNSKTTIKLEIFKINIIKKKKKKTGEKNEILDCVKEHIPSTIGSLFGSFVWHYGSTVLCLGQNDKCHYFRDGCGAFQPRRV
jgi:hypothetical protein